MSPRRRHPADPHVINDVYLPGDKPVGPRPGEIIWLGGRLGGVGAVCENCGRGFITSPVDPARRCLPCDIKPLLEAEAIVEEYPVLKRLLS